MGEAKRKNAQIKAVQEDLRRRLDAGEFGQPASRYCMVVDKSPRGRELLQALRAAADRFAGLGELLGAESMQLWEASALFRFAVLCGGEGKAHERTLLAVDVDRLLGDSLPRALRRVPQAGFVVGVDTDCSAAVQATVTTAR